MATDVIGKIARVTATIKPDHLGEVLIDHRTRQSGGARRFLDRPAEELETKVQNVFVGHRPRVGGDPRTIRRRRPKYPSVRAVGPLFDIRCLCDGGTSDHR
ncbi:hypothetical protein [Nocardia sp. CA-120079]|uniref:hypothetical protein n=1 Tax=Nocardia sp. CA-120079 TaxID=3239974 RepID=UPI003D98A354